MYKYVQLQDDVVIGISFLNGEVVAENLLLVADEVNVEMGSIYNRSTGEFTPPVPIEQTPQPTIEDMQMQTLLNTEYLVVMSELTNI